RQTVTGGRTRAHAPGLRPRTGEAATWTMYLEPGISRYLPLLGDYRGVTFAEPQAFRINNVERVLALQRDPPKMLAYRVDGMMADAVMPDSARPSSANHDATAAAADRYLALPIGGADLQRLQEFVAPLRAASPAGAEAFARVASEWLGSRHTYSLQSALPPGAGDPLVRWLDSNAPGHCEFFAGGLVLLTRAAGFPSRLITGFKGGTWNAYSNSFAVRNANAHAWCEVYDAAKGGWVRIDPTPGAEAEAAGGGEAGAAGRTNRSIDEGWQARFESLRVFWYRQVVNFDQSSQVELAVAAKQAMENAGQRLKAWVETRAVKWQRWLAQPWGWTRALRVAGAAAIVVALFWFWRAFGRGWWLRWRSRHRRDVRHDPVRREAARWLRRLAHASGRADTAEVENALARLRYGHPKTWPNPATVFRAAKRTLRR
ncbi:MAG TPA: transglutaminase-like domain-containing protein, partial [Candidatus Synoicihabitans sp.]|nr:transglutaminase-like domain-containing protein [Candidatus Synoicihabitans sp.]